MTRSVSDWWPRCALCHKPVERLAVEETALVSGPIDYRVICHGKMETITGMTPALALQMDEEEMRLPDAFRPKASQREGNSKQTNVPGAFTTS